MAKNGQNKVSVDLNVHLIHFNDFIVPKHNNNKIEFYTAQQLYDKIKLVSNINPTNLLPCKVIFQSVQRKKYYFLHINIPNFVNKKSSPKF